MVSEPVTARVVAKRARLLKKERTGKSESKIDSGDSKLASSLPVTGGSGVGEVRPDERVSAPKETGCVRHPECEEVDCTAVAIGVKDGR